MSYDPEKERRLKDFCQHPRCRAESDIIVQGKGYCEKHYPSITNEVPQPHDCECCDCTGPVASHKEAKVGVLTEQRSVLNYSDAKHVQKEEKEVQTKPQAGRMYMSIEDYTAKTSRRFRMTKDQKARNLTREQAFEETYG